MRLDIVAYALQPLRRKTLAGRQRETPDKTLSDADTQDCAQAFYQDPVREAAFDLLGQGRDDLAEQGVLQRILVFEARYRCSELRQQVGIQIRIPDHSNEPRCAANLPKREPGGTICQIAGRDS